VINQDQAMVDNATSQLAARNATMNSQRDPRLKTNGRNEALTRRLSRIRQNRNG
jgi:hypothetical protein